MTRNIVTRLLCVATGLLFGPLAGCSGCGGPTVTCGAGTQADKNGKCVPTSPLACGDGTTAQGGKCVITTPVTCGTGTTQSGNSCVVNLSCGSGTVQQGNSCVVASPETCGAGTHDDGAGNCVPDGPAITCGQGTTQQGNTCIVTPPQDITSQLAATNLVLVIDSAPSPDGSTIFYVAQVTDGDGNTTHSLFSVPADGTAAPTEIVGDFAMPLNIAVSSAGDHVFVADAQFINNQDDVNGGAIFDVNVTAGTKSLVNATYGFRIRGMDISTQGGNDTVFFTGFDPASGEPGLFALNVAGNAVSTVLAGDPFVDPQGVAVVDFTKVLVTDTSVADEALAASDHGQGALISVAVDNAGLGTATVIVTGLDLGNPAGVSTTVDGAQALVSGIDRGNDASIVYVVQLANNAVSVTNSGLAGNNESGGLHRAQQSNTFAWCGTAVNDDGTSSGHVYRITF